MTGNEKFPGVYSAICTPYTNAGTINSAMIEKLVEYHIDAGVDGIWLCGGSAEAMLLSSDERKQIVEVAANAAAGRIKVLVHVGALGTENVLDLARHAATQPVDGLSAVPPFFHSTDPRGLHDYYEAIAKATRLPVMCYHVPELTSIEMTYANVVALLDIDGFAGLKYSGYNHFDMARVIAIEDAGLTVLSGNDEVFLGALAMGAHGCVGLNHNYVPRTFVRIYRDFRAGNMDAARRDQYEINRILPLLIKYGSFSVMKHIMKRKGMDCGVPRRPLRPLSDQEANEVDALIDPIGILWEDG